MRRRLAARGSGAYATSRAGGTHGYGTSRAFNSGALSPSRQRIAAMTARREQEMKTAREREQRARAHARQMAAVTARLQAAREAAEEARREETKRAIAASRQEHEERLRIAAEAARKNNIPALGRNIQRAMPPPPTEKQLLRRKRRDRPEWGSGHAGGYKLKAAQRPTSAAQQQQPQQRSQRQCWEPPMTGGKMYAPPVAFHGSTYAYQAASVQV